ncbi:MAG: hypothetical protein IPK77_06320 [Cellvibrio sp.]|nr:hypothetical protein [Cellvibrio sp.]
MANNLYLSLPVWGQNAALSVYGANLYRQRFNGEIPEIYTSDLNLFSSPTEEMFKLQQLRFQELLTHYKDTFLTTKNSCLV